MTQASVWTPIKSNCFIFKILHQPVSVWRRCLTLGFSASAACLGATETHHYPLSEKGGIIAITCFQTPRTHHRA